MDDKPHEPPQQDSPANVLSYVSPNSPMPLYVNPGPGGVVTIARFSREFEAAAPTAELAAEGIECQVLNANVNALGAQYSADIELQVFQIDAARAIDVLARMNSDDVEPAEHAADTRILDDAGQPIHLIEAAAFDDVRELRDAHTVLATAAVTAYLPALVPRGQRPIGTGKRFILRVAEEDVDRAAALLRQAQEDADEDDSPRCPRCKAWRVFPVLQAWTCTLAFFGFAKWPAKMTECLACHYRGPTKEFN